VREHLFSFRHFCEVLDCVLLGKNKSLELGLAVDFQVWSFEVGEGVLQLFCLGLFLFFVCVCVCVCVFVCFEAYCPVKLFVNSFCNLYSSTITTRVEGFCHHFWNWLLFSCVYLYLKELLLCSRLGVFHLSFLFCRGELLPYGFIKKKGKKAPSTFFFSFFFLMVS
jgi:hypothetical protein